MIRPRHPNRANWRPVDGSRSFRPRIGNPLLRPMRPFRSQGPQRWQQPTIPSLFERPRLNTPSYNNHYYNSCAEQNECQYEHQNEQRQYEPRDNRHFEKPDTHHFNKPDILHFDKHGTRHFDKADIRHLNKLDNRHYDQSDHRQFDQPDGRYYVQPDNRHYEQRDLKKFVYNRPPSLKHSEQSSHHDNVRHHAQTNCKEDSYHDAHMEYHIPSLHTSFDDRASFDAPHRPPVLEHYHSEKDEPNTYNKSVKDTVDIVKRRLIERKEKSPIKIHTDTSDITSSLPAPVEKSTYAKVTDRKHSHRVTPRLNEQIKRSDKQQASKMKNKIVQEIFKMDKSALQKFVDDPNASSKFEFAIQSLITESRNSLNRQLRSAAEKSLLDANDTSNSLQNNSVYEDTFLKEMQCLLDPQETIELTDIKPFVMAELSKVLQLDDFNSLCTGEYSAANFNLMPEEELEPGECVENDEYPEYSTEDFPYYDEFNADFKEEPGAANLFDRKAYVKLQPEKSEKCFENQNYSVESFENNYHCAIKEIKPEISFEPENEVNISADINKIVDDVDGSFDLVNYVNKEDEVFEIKSNSKLESVSNEKTPKLEKSKEFKESKKESLKNNESSKKRSSDTKILHHKEKRKKYEKDKSSKKDSKKKVLNKNIIINVNDCSNKQSQEENTSKSVFNLYFSKNDSSQTNSSNECSEKTYKTKKMSSKGSSRDKTPKSSMKNSEEHTSPLKQINMFEQQPKKVAVHTPHRMSSTQESEQNKVNPNTDVKILKAYKEKDHSIFGRVKKRAHEFTQTPKVKQQTKHTQVKPKQTTVEVQTEPVDFTCKPAARKATDVFERMKEIDMEIQQLIEEKFKIYNNLENKDNIQTFGMTVVNMDITSQNQITENLEEKEEDPEIETPRKPKALDKINLNKNSPKIGIIKPNKKANSEKALNQTKYVDSVGDYDQQSELSKSPTLWSPVKTRGRKLSCGTPTKVKKQIMKKQKPKKPIKSSSPSISTIDLLKRLHDIKECVVLLNMINETDIEENDSVRLTEEIITEEIVTEETIPEITGIEMQEVETVTELIVDGSFDIDRPLECSNETTVEQPIIENTELYRNNNECDTQIEDSVKLYDFSSGCERRDTMSVTGHDDSIIAIEYVKDNFLAASQDGNVYYYNSHTGKLLLTLKGSNLAVTCLVIIEDDDGDHIVYAGSLDSRIRYYKLKTGMEQGPECNVLSPIQTMDHAWDTIYVGTRTGFVLQFECKNNMLIPVSSVKLSEQAILSLKAIKEGPRKVLLVASRSENVTIRDAQTGLLLRTLEGPNMTVYTILFIEGGVYCGTSSNFIQVFDYASGNNKGVHKGGKGAVCLKSMGGLLFAGCYDGCVYVYKQGLIDPIAELRGPKVMLLSLNIVDSKIIVGYKDKSLFIWNIPPPILDEMIL